MTIWAHATFEILMLKLCLEISYSNLKFVFSKKATKFEEIFTVDLTLCSKCQIDGEDFVSFCGLLRKHELSHYHSMDRAKFSRSKIR